MIRESATIDFSRVRKMLIAGGLACVAAAVLGAGAMAMADSAFADEVGAADASGALMAAGLRAGEAPGGFAADGASGASDASGASQANGTLRAQDFSHDIDDYYASAHAVKAGTSVNADSLGLRVYDYDDVTDEVFELVYGTDYEIAGYYDYYDDETKLAGAPTAVGEYYAELVGKGAYHGSMWVWFEIVDMSDLANYSANTRSVKSGKAVNADSLELRVYDYDDDADELIELVYGTDYALTGYCLYDDDNDDNPWIKLDGTPTAVGEYYAELTGKGAYHGTLHAWFEILDMHDLTNYYMSSYDIALGKDINVDSLNLRVYDYDDDTDSITYLTPGSDFVISGYYDNNYDKLAGAPTTAGYYYVEVTGVGAYHGTRSSWFEVYDLSDLATYYVRSSDVRFGTAVNADSLGLRVYFYGNGDDEDIELTYGTDYEISGYYSYDGEHADSKVRLAAAPTEVGDYYVELTGKGAYHGTGLASFEILDMHNLSSYDVDTNPVKFGTAVNADSLNLRVYSFGYGDAEDLELAYGTDYEISGYYDYEEDGDEDVMVKLDAAPTEVGEYCVELTGKGAYYGTRRAWFDILDMSDLSSYRVMVDDVMFGTAVNADSLELRVYDYDYDNDLSRDLVYGTDYVISGYYDDDDNKLADAPTAVGEYYVELTGIGAYHGTRRAWFDILDRYDLSNYETDAHNVVLGTAVNAESIGLRVYNYYGYTNTSTDLVYGTDYEISAYYTSEGGKLAGTPTAAGEYYAELIGKGAYHGTQHAWFEILDMADINSYSANRTEIDEASCTLNLRFRERLEGNNIVNLVVGKDYEVAGWSKVYQGAYLASAPSQAGSYYLTINGIGAYKGTSTIYIYLENDLKAPISISTTSTSASDAEKAAAAQAIAKAQAKVDAATVSADGTDVNTDKTWIPASSKAQFDAAVKAFNSITNPTSYDVDVVRQAAANAEAAIKVGTKSATSGDDPSAGGNDNPSTSSASDQTVVVADKTVKAKAKQLKKKAVTIKAAKVVKGNSAKTALTYTKVKANKKNGKFKVASNGAITVKKGLKKGAYKLTIKASAAATSAYNAATETFVVTIKVK